MRDRMTGPWLLALAAFFVVVITGSPPVIAAELTVATAEINPVVAPATPAAEPYIPAGAEQRTLRAVVMGDSLADGLYAGLYRVMKDDPRLTFIRKSKINTGIVRRDRYNWNEAARAITAEDSYDIAILVFGTNDLQSIRESGKAYHFRQPGWETRFRERIDDILSVLKAAKISAYWVGIPITRKDRYQDDYAYVNGFFREEAARNGVRFVDTWKEFADKNGDFTPYGTFGSDAEIQLRADDGVHFTPQGYEKYASIVARVLESDIPSPAATDTCRDRLSGCNTLQDMAPALP